MTIGQKRAPEPPRSSLWRRRGYRTLPIALQPLPAMSFFRTRAFLFYAVGILCVAAGAQVSSETHSMLPLALGAATAVMATVGLVKAIRERRRPAQRRS